MPLKLFFYIQLISFAMISFLPAQHTFPPGGPSLLEEKEREDKFGQSLQSQNVQSTPQLTRSAITKKHSTSKNLNNGERTIKFLNQTNVFINAWIPRAHGCWHPETISQESGIITLPYPAPIYIYTPRGLFLLTQQYSDLILSHDRSAPGRFDNREILRKPLSETTSIIVTVHNDGSVTYSDRDRL